MAKDSFDTLPTLEDFTEKSLGSAAADFKAAAEATKNADAAKAGTKTPEELEAEKTAAEAKAKADTEKAEKEKADKAKADADPNKAAKAKAKADADAAKKKAADEITEEAFTALKAKADEDLESLTEEEKDVLIQKGYLEEEKEATDNFWKDVEKIHGIKVEVDFGKVDPESPEGAALRDRALVDSTVADYLEYLKNSFPKSYKLLEHEANGGDIQELFQTSKTDYSKIDLKEDNKEQQKSILTDFYKAKGFDEKRIIRLLEADEDSEEGLFTVAKAALEDQKAKQVASEQAIIEKAKAAKAAKEDRDQQFTKVIRQIADSGKIGDFEITDKKDKEGFYKFLLANTYSDNKEGYQVVLPINQESLNSVLQQMLFAYKKGDVSAYVKRAADTARVRKLKRKVDQHQDKASSQETNTQVDVNKLPTLDVFSVDKK